jgi:hypothetical protein
LHNIIPIGGVVLIGGQSGNTILDTLYELTSISGTWTEIDSKLKIPRRNFAAWPILSRLLSDCSLGDIFFYSISFSSFITSNFGNKLKILGALKKKIGGLPKIR